MSSKVGMGEGGSGKNYKDAKVVGKVKSTHILLHYQRIHLQLLLQQQQ